MQHQFGYVEVSAKNGLGVQVAFNRMTQEVYKFQALDFEADKKMMAEQAKLLGRSGMTMRTSSDQSSLVLDPSRHQSNRAAQQQQEEEEDQLNPENIQLA